ncbi:toxin-antitoxin system YwqK [Faustovirus]|nr:toxin-antitoxin system YwqK [Faustovirus]
MDDILCYRITALDTTGQLIRVITCLNRYYHNTVEKIVANAVARDHITKYASHTLTYAIILGGVRNGSMTLVNNTGMLCASANYRLGQLHGTLWIDKGTSKYTINYYNGRLHGDYKLDQGNHVVNIRFKHDIMHGDMLCQNISEFGIRTCTATYINGLVEGNELGYHVDSAGNKYFDWENQYINGKYHGRVKHYYVEKINNKTVSNLIFDAEYEHGRVIKTYLSGNGDVIYDTFNKYGKTYKIWRRGNKILHKSNIWVNGYAYGVLQSSWYTKTEVYEVGLSNNSMTYYMEYNPDGDIEVATQCNYLLTHGYSTTFHSNGRVRWVTQYRDNYKHGVEKNYARNGQLTYINTNKYGVLVSHNVLL